MQAEELIEAPLYLQVATRVKHQIAEGKLRDGDRLPSLREGADRWGVNLHTVRRAYTLLESDGLVQTAPRSGTRVTASAVAHLRTEEADLTAYLDSVVRTAALRFGIGVDELSRRLSDSHNAAPEPAWVLECSTSLAQHLAQQVAARSGWDVRPWVLRKGSHPPDGFHLSTYYHYAEVRRLLAHRGHQPMFFGVRMERANLKRLCRLARRAGRLVLLAVDAASGGAVASELAQELRGRIPVELRVTRRPRAELGRIPDPVPVLVTPQNWDRLTAEERRADRVFPLTLQPDEGDLARIAEGLAGRVRTVGGTRAPRP